MQVKVRLRRTRLAQELARRNLSQNRWAQKLGVSRSYLSMMLSGKRPYPGPAVRKRLLEELDCSFQDLFEFEKTRADRRRALTSPPDYFVEGARALPSDFQSAYRSLARSPGFFLIATLTLALGIAANLTVFSVANGLLWKPLPLPRPEQLLYISESYPDDGQLQVDTSFPNYCDLSELNRSLADMAAYDTTSLILRSREGPSERVLGVATEQKFFQVLGVAPIRGRVFSLTEQKEDRLAAVISHRLWQQYFGGRPAVLGSEITLDSRRGTVVGVMPPDFHFPELHDVWIPLREDDSLRDRSHRELEIVARLQPEISISQARADLNRAAETLAKTSPEANQGMKIFLVPFREEAVGSSKQSVILMLLGVVGIVLIVGCLNVTNVALARASQRARETAIRSALGASLLRLGSQYALESFIVAGLAGGLGLLLGYWGLRSLQAYMPPLPYWMSFEFDYRVYSFIGILIFLSALIMVLVPALRAGRKNLAAPLLGSGRVGSESSRKVWFRKGLVATEICLALMLLIGTGLLIETHRNQSSIELGFEPENVLTVRNYLIEEHYRDPSRRIQYYQSVVQALSSIPSVTGVSAASWLALQGSRQTYVYPEDSAVGLRQYSSRMIVMPGYFETAGMEILQGRTLSRADLGFREGRVAVVSQTLAERLWPKQPVIGKRLRVDDQESEAVRVIGIVRDARLRSIDQSPEPAIYLPYSYNPQYTMTLLLRTSSENPMELLPVIRTTIARIDADAALARSSPWAEVVAQSRWFLTTVSWVFGIFSSIVLALALVGLYGLSTLLMSWRHLEFGIRVAVGASRSRLLRMAISESLWISAAGTVAGTAGALFAGRALKVLLVGVTPTDPATFLKVIAIFVVVLATAAIIPAIRALRVDPLETLQRGR